MVMRQMIDRETGSVERAADSTARGGLPSASPHVSHFTFHPSPSPIQLRSRRLSEFNHSTINPVSAFTLIELLVVIAIMMILAALVIPIGGAVKRQRIVSR